MNSGVMKPTPAPGLSAFDSSMVNSSQFRSYEETAAELIVKRCRLNKTWTLQDVGRVMFETLAAINIDQPTLANEQIKQLLVATVLIVKQVSPDRLQRF
jgi:hypothetical protein